MNRFALTLLVTLIAGCQSWKYIDTQNTLLDSEMYSLHMPVDWKQHEFGDITYLSLDGIQLNMITISHEKYSELDDKEKTVESKLVESMLIEEIGEVYYSILAKQFEVQNINLELLSNSPISIDGNDGFYLNMLAKGSKGLEIAVEAKGVKHKDGVLIFKYQAPVLVYYERSHQDFKRMTGTIKLKG